VLTADVKVRGSMRGFTCAHICSLAAIAASSCGLGPPPPPFFFFFLDAPLGGAVFFGAAEEPLLRSPRLGMSIRAANIDMVSGLARVS